MPVTRVTWASLPYAARAAAQECAGTVIEVTDVASGMNSGLAARLHAQHGAFFVKGMPLDHPAMSGQRREIAVNSFLPPSAPRICWHVQAGGWDLIGFELINGRAADFSPGSPDLPLVIAALRELANVPSSTAPLLDCVSRYAGYCSSPEMLRGDALLHTDINPENVLIDTDRDTARLIDWAWPSKGAGFVDLGVWLLRLMAAGHSVTEAESWAAQLPAWGQASPEALTELSAASGRLWDEIAEQAPDGTLWQKKMQAAAQEWADHRRALAS